MVRHFFAQADAKACRRSRSSRPALYRLRRHRWPGNVRELENLRAGWRCSIRRRRLPPPSSSRSCPQPTAHDSDGSETSARAIRSQANAGRAPPRRRILLEFEDRSLPAGAGLLICHARRLSDRELLATRYPACVTSRVRSAAMFALAIQIRHEWLAPDASSGVPHSQYRCAGSAMDHVYLRSA